MSEFESERSIPDLNRENGTIETERRVKGVRCETGCDFTLPDYMGDVKKLLCYSCDVIPSGKFDGSGEASFCGIVAYKVLYTDSDNKLTLAEFTSDYEISVKIDDTYIDSAAVTELSSLSVRPQGPRKICAKAGLVSDIYISCEGSVPVMNSDENIEKNTADIKVHSAEYLASGEREYAEEAARLEGVLAEEVEVLLSGAKVRIDKVSCEDNGVRIVGAIEAYSLLKIDEDATARVEKEIPIDEVIDRDTEYPCVSVMARGYVTSATVSVNADDGESAQGASVVFSITAEYEVFADKNTNITVVRDAYTVGAMSDASYDAFSYSTLEDVVNESRNMTFEVPRDELSCDSITEILHTEVSLKQGDVSVKDGTMTASGELNFNTVVRTAGDDGYCSIKTSHAFEICAPISAKATSLTLGRVYLKPYGGTSSVDAAKLYLKCSINICATTVCENEETVVTELHKRQEIGNSSHGVVTVYYPDDNDTLWSVGKKYAAALAKIAKDNSLSESVFTSGAEPGSLAGVDRLMIIE